MFLKLIKTFYKILKDFLFDLDQIFVILNEIERLLIINIIFIKSLIKINKQQKKYFFASKLLMKRLLEIKHVIVLIEDLFKWKL